MGMLRALMSCKVKQAALGLIYDPQAAAAAHQVEAWVTRLRLLLEGDLALLAMLHCRQPFMSNIYRMGKGN
jgi:microcystin degradation protein MlrC